MRPLRTWLLLPWVFLTVAIVLGGWWAYEVLGWGGYWFWDPVENASLMPWLAATALLHSVAVLAARNALKAWTMMLAVIAFTMSMVGTFLVRSGILTSVHSFAVDPTRGTFILALLGIYIGGALAVFGLRAGSVAEGETGHAFGHFFPIGQRFFQRLDQQMAVEAEELPHDLGVEAVHHRGDDDQRRDAHRHPADGDHGDERKEARSPAAGQVAARDAPFEVHDATSDNCRE